MPFHFHAYEVDLDYSRLTRCLKEVKRLWDVARPPKGATNCKDCRLLTRLIDFENNLRGQDQWLFASFPDYRDFLLSQDYFRQLTRRLPTEIIEDGWDRDGGMWGNWDFS